MLGRYRTVALRLPLDQGARYPAEPGWLGKMNAAFRVTGYPVIQLMTLCETGRGS